MAQIQLPHTGWVYLNSEVRLLLEISVVHQPYSGHAMTNVVPRQYYLDSQWIPSFDSPVSIDTWIAATDFNSSLNPFFAYPILPAYKEQYCVSEVASGVGSFSVGSMQQYIVH